MNTIKIAATGMVLGLMIIADIPLLPVKLVPEAQAVFGVRRRTAVVAYSAGKASASSSQQQAAAVQQPAAPAPSTSGVPTGTVLEALPQGCNAVTVGNTQYQECSGTFYRTAFMGDKLVYVAVEKPV